MLKLAIALLIVSAAVALIAIVPALGIGGRILPGYFFRARGSEAVKCEKKLLRIFACLLWTVSVFIAAAGVIAYFIDMRLILIASGMFIVVAVLWTVYFIKGDFKKLAEKAKKLSE